MNKIISILICLLCCCKLSSQELSWTEPTYAFFEGKVSALDNNIRYTLDSTMTVSERSAAVDKVQKHIAECLLLINESEIEDPIHIILAKDRDEMAKYVGAKIIGAYMPTDQHVPETMLFCIYGTNYDPLKHELMHFVSISKWGENIETERACWLEEGLASWAGQEAENCDGHNIEERYAYLLQNNLLLDLDRLCYPENDPLEHKIFYTQTAYIVGYLLDNYGTDKLKVLWQSNVSNFDNIYGKSFEAIVDEMNNALRQKNKVPANFNWEAFQKACID